MPGIIEPPLTLANKITAAISRCPLVEGQEIANLDDQQPAFEALPLAIAQAWVVQVTWADGKKEQVKGFVTGAMANAWINGRGAQDWLAQKRPISSRFNFT